MNYQTIEVEVAGGIGTIWLNRPDIRNAMNETVIAELAHAAHACEQDERVRVVVLAGRGKAFCAGADLGWMRKPRPIAKRTTFATHKRWRPCSTSYTG